MQMCWGPTAGILIYKINVKLFVSYHDKGVDKVKKG